MSRAGSKDRALEDHVGAELAALADVLIRLDPAAWSTPSLCEGWTVREAVAHVTMPARRSNANVMAGLALAGFRWNAFADKAARRDAALSADMLLADLRSTRLAAWRPPGGGPESALVHALIHALDCTVPLGADRNGDPERVRIALGALVAPASLKHFGTNLEGIELHATDTPWSYGTGRSVSATSQQIALMLSGRTPIPR